jgi:hypothetical protein
MQPHEKQILDAKTIIERANALMREAAARFGPERRKSVEQAIELAESSGKILERLAQVQLNIDSGYVAPSGGDVTWKRIEWEMPPRCCPVCKRSGDNLTQQHSDKDAKDKVVARPFKCDCGARFKKIVKVLTESQLQKLGLDTIES